MTNWRMDRIREADIAEDDVLKRVTCALDDLLDRDNFLLEHDASERSMTHRLGVYLEDLFPGYHVDCEYNRRGKDGTAKRIAAQGSAGKCVLPDIIVHCRGTDARNLVSIEVKKNTSKSEDSEFAREKLYAFASELNFKFQYCLLITLHIGSPPKYEIERVPAARTG